MSGIAETRCQSCRGRGRKTIRQRKMVVIRTRTGIHRQRQVTCPYCQGSGIPA